jgi:cation:H+ antiporter
VIALDLSVYILAFLGIWFGSGLIVTSTSKFAEKLRLSAFALSFLLLGILTSTPEFSVGLQAVISKNPQIFVGNLLGGIIVIFLFIIPLLAIVGNGISLKHQFDNKTLLVAIGVIMAPAVLLLDKKVSVIEGFFLIGLYIFLVILVQIKNGIFDTENSKLLDKKAYSYKDLLKILIGIGLVFVSSNVIVDKTLVFAGILNIPEFYIGLLVISLGTDLPEITLVIRSVLSKKNEVAMGDYLGAAAASTLLFGIFTFLSRGEELRVDNFIVTFAFMAIGLGSFFILSYKEKFISRASGFVLISAYFSFVIIELAT